MRLRHQLAVYSPIPARAPLAAAAVALRLKADARDELAGVLRDTYDADDVVLCGSGTQALQLAIECARGVAGSDALVALPAFSCFDVASAAIGAGGPVVLYDLEPETLSPNADSLARAIERGARVAVIAPLYGIPVDWASIARLAASRGVLLIEDAAQGHGAALDGRPVGAFGDLATISFGRGKGWTGGSGGALLIRRASHPFGTPRPATAPSLDAGTLVGLTAQWVLGRPSVYGLPRALPGLSLGETVYRAPRAPTAMSRAAASALLATRSGSLGESDRRRANAEQLGEMVRGNDSLAAVVSGAGRSASPGYLRFPVLGRIGLAGFPDAAGALRLGVAASYPKPLSELAELSGRLVNGGERFPGASRLVAELFTLPSHSLLSPAEQASLSQMVREYGVP